MKPGISQRSSIQQQLTMTPQLAEAIAILAMPVTELATWTREQLEENPVLEEEADVVPVKPEAQPASAEAAQAEQERDLHEEDRRALEELEKWDWTEYFDSVADGEESQLAEPAEEDYYSEVPQKPPNLAETLLEQLNERTSDSEILAIGYELIGALDEAGYLTEDVTSVARRMKKLPAAVEKVLVDYIQTLEPAGVGARNLAECLRIQLREKSVPPDNPAYAMLEHLALVPHPDRMAKALGLEADAVREGIALIQSLNPKPGLALGFTPNPDIIPEIEVHLSEGKPVITLEQWNVPTLKISPKYREMLEHPESLTSEAKRYLGRMYGRALWIIRAVERRRRTIQDVAKVVFGKQKAFLEKGRGVLTPLTMQEVADLVGVNVSTVSRAVANKYVQTPHGVFPFRHFFRSSLPTTRGGAVSSEVVQEALRTMIAEEDPAHPLSDDAIVKKLAGQGIKVARRTITKYRNLMGIADTALRRRKS
jgi:RNA polymerase sigma-54 factor